MKKTVVFLVLFVLLLAVYIYVKMDKERTVEQHISLEKAPLIEDFSPESVRKIKITDRKEDTVTTLEKKNGQWTVSEKDNAVADKKKMNDLLDALASMRKGDKKEGGYDSSKASEFGFDEGISLSFENKDLLMGKSGKGRTPIVFNNELYFSPFDKKRVFTPYDGEWREKKIFYENKQIKSIVFKKLKDTGEDIRITKDEKGNILINGSDSGNVEEAEKIWKQVNRLRVSDFLDDNYETVDYKMKEDKKIPVEKAELSLTFIDGSTQELVFTGKRINDKNIYIIEKEGVPFGISEYYYNAVVGRNLRN
ncbi:MAG: DUF4340 domain-containing protein [bacterium]